MKKKKVIYILHDIEMGGVEMALISAIPELNAKFELKVMVLGKIDPGLTAHLSLEEQACLQTFNYKLYTYPAHLSKLVSFVLNFQPDIMICSLWRASLIGSMVKRLNKNITFYSFIHSTRFAHVFDRICTLAASKSADKILADSKAASDFISVFKKPSTIVKVISFYTHPSPPERKIAEFNSNNIKLMFLGRLNPIKNLPLAVDMVHDLRERGWPVTLDIYGRDNGVLNETIQHIENKQLSNYINFKAEVNHSGKLAAFSSHNFLIQLSSKEGMAMSVAEAMQHGMVCIVSPVGEIPNYAKDMASAIFVDITDQKEWDVALAKIEKVFQNPSLYEQISTTCFENARNISTYSATLTKTIQEDLDKAS
ncbi:glycosyltransferase family 4 protein [Dyadobacter sp. CY326]|uniref:glycosyltransferase family 4 protein n=1 Tax=Dyadobacter sp. CY326 TaxID=2907300 RepID=UPI001F17D6C7|nr:glycosyltransferase [Dyadobacter sp. CY326]MCE7065371.1 glycosyltransferase [Dyadobacter sp. CY326]